MDKTALILAGGGARAAYQVGCLRHIAHTMPHWRPQILTGISAGAINAIHLASFRGSWQEAVEQLRALWLGLDTDLVYRTGFKDVVAKLLGAAVPVLTGGRFGRERMRGMVNSDPLRDYLSGALTVQGERIMGTADNIMDGLLDALAILTTDYDTGRSTAWIEAGLCELRGRGQLDTRFTQITMPHIMASSALPLFFPAIRLEGHWHGDGGVRLTAPLSPALHLGATRILAVSPRKRPTPQPRLELPTVPAYPSPAQIAGVMLNAIFLDNLDYDALQMTRINKLLHAAGGDEVGGMRPVDVMVLRPSEDLGVLAQENESRLPRAFRFFERGLAGREMKSADALAMVNFEPEYVGALIHMGEVDAAARHEEIEAFLSGGSCAVPVW
ncbi:MAG: patatin-like phospholipase family protein [Pseudomonadales bacterium]|nr:patatin-like phospholipase family protein [Pseudomonadales bacterium]MCP5185099.1 patatin-like phospholipase family protein [Pseudomonadales bacterium]